MTFRQLRGILPLPSYSIASTSAFLHHTGPFLALLSSLMSEENKPFLMTFFPITSLQEMCDWHVSALGTIQWMDLSGQVKGKTFLPSQHALPAYHTHCPAHLCLETSLSPLPATHHHLPSCPYPHPTDPFSSSPVSQNFVQHF